MDLRRQFALLTLLFVLALAPAARAQNTENGLAELAQGRYAEALRLLAAAVEENPSDSRAVRGLAQAHLKLGRLDDAAQWLRRTVQLLPDDHESRFELARILSWRDATRPEALLHFGKLIEAQPENLEWRMTFAEVLSWQPALHEKAAQEYEEVLACDPENRTAQIRLALLRSWGGDLRRAEQLYNGILLEAPDEALAILGKGEVLAWSGRPLEARRWLGRLNSETPERSRWLLARASADYGLGRYDRAHTSLSSLLQTEPGNPYALELRDAIEDWRRPHLEVGYSFMRQSGDPLTSRVEFNRPFARVRFPAGAGSRAEVSYEPTLYFNRAATTREHRVGLGWEGQPTDRLRLRAQLYVADYSLGPTDYTGSVALGWRVNDRVRMDLGFTRAPLLDSVQAVAGVEANGLRLGRARLNQVETAVHYYIPLRKIDFTLRYTDGAVTADATDTNRRIGLDFGAGKSFRVGQRGFLRLGYAFTHFGFDRDLGGFPTAAGPARDTGGYFSPTRFFNHAAQVGFGGEWKRRWSYFFGGSLGAQQAETRFSPLDIKRLSSYATTSHTLRLTRELHLVFSYEYINVGGAFRRNTFSAGIRRYF